MDRVITDGDVVAMDAIGAYQGYGFDVNRTTVKGPPDDERRALLDAVEEATSRAVEASIAGATVGDMAAAARAVFAATPFAEHAGAMMGHGIGLETVEEPYIQPGGTAVLEAGMVLCVEPGLFVPGWAGASVEQEIIISPTGPPGNHHADPGSALVGCRGTAAPPQGVASGRRLQRYERA